MIQRQLQSLQGEPVANEEGFIEDDGDLLLCVYCVSVSKITPPLNHPNLFIPPALG